MSKADHQRLRWPIFLITAPLIITADQITKSWIRAYPEGSTIFKSGILRIVHFENPGAAFGLFPGLSTLLLVFGLVASSFILAYLIYLYKRVKLFTGFIGWIGISLVFAGAVGNLIDRLNPNVDGITDFIYIGWWPAFNVSDSSITVGVILLACALLFMPVKQDAK